METTEKVNLLSVILFLATGILHLITPIFYGLTSFGIGMFIFGVIYTSLGILVQLKKESKTIGFLSIIFPIIGGTLGTILLIISFNLYLLCTCILFDPIIVILRIYIYKQL